MISGQTWLGSVRLVQIWSGLKLGGEERGQLAPGVGGSVRVVDAGVGVVEEAVVGVVVDMQLMAHIIRFER